MPQDKKITDATETELAATGTDGAPRPPSLSARLASTSTSASEIDGKDAKTGESSERKADIAKGALPPPLPSSSKPAGVAPPPLPPGTTKTSAGNSDTASPGKENSRSSDKKANSGERKTAGKEVSSTKSDDKVDKVATDKTPAEKNFDLGATKPGDARTGKASTPAPTLSFFPKANGEKPATEKVENDLAGAAAAAAAAISKPDPKLDSSPPPDASEIDETDSPIDSESGLRARTSRRQARRRPAGPVRERLAANDDAPSIGGLIYALQQKPSSQPYQYAAIGSVIWAILGSTALWLVLSAEADPFTALIQKPTTFLMLTAVLVPILVFWFLAMLASRSEELRLRSSTMAEVAIRLAEPDRLAEQSTASLGQAVRRQVGFMNDAVSRALGRAGELEALVHNEVSALERSYEENERKIRGLIQELSGERAALLTTSEDVHATLKSLGSEVPDLIEKLSTQQMKLAQIIEGAGDNLTLLETSLSQGARQIETSLGNRTDQLQTVLESYTGAVDGALQARTEQMHAMLADHTQTLGSTLSETTRHLDKSLGGHGSEIRTMLEVHTGRMGETLGETTGQMQGMLETYTGALAEALASRTEEMQEAFEGYMLTLDTSISNRTDNLQSVFEAYAHALDTTLASRAEALDTQLVARTRALDDAFNDRLRLFDETIVRTTSAIDEAVGEKAVALTSALDSHAKNFRDTLTRQTADIDDTLTNGISAVRRSSENVTRQSLKAIEGLASQSDLLKRVSENLLGQINSVTNRFENQGQLIMQAANALESANYKIDSALKQRHSELSGTLDRLSHKADEFSQFIEGYSTTIEDQLSVAETRAKAAAEELRQGAHTHQRETIADIERFRNEAGEQSQRALADLRERLSTVSNEVVTQFGNLNSRFDETSEVVRQRAQETAKAIDEEQAKLKEKFKNIPAASRESAEAMRRSLQDQLNALEQLSKITHKEARLHDISEPVGRPSEQPRPARQIVSDPSSLRASYDGNRTDTDRQLSSLSSSLAREMHSRPLRSPTANPVGASTGVPNNPSPAEHQAKSSAQPQAHNQQPQQPAASKGRSAGAPRTQHGTAPSQADAWSLGDLLKRASLDDDPAAATAESQARPGEAAPASHPAAAAPLPDVSLMVQAIDPATASEIWERLRSGQRGILVPSLYPPNARVAFDELTRRYRSEPHLREAIGRFLSDFENKVRGAEASDPTGRLVQNHLMSEVGRAYLFLAHVSGRLDG